MQAGKHFVIVAVNKELQRKKNIISGITIIDREAPLRYALQSGTVISIGLLSAKMFPEMEVGDILVYHHNKENDPSLIVKETKEEKFISIRGDDNYSIKGIKKPNGQIIPHPSELWCKALPKTTSNNTDIWAVNKSGILLFTGEQWEDSKDLREKLDEIETHTRFMADSKIPGKQLVHDRVAQNVKEKEAITKRLNDKLIKEVELVHIHPTTSKDVFSDIKAGDHVFFEAWIEYEGYELNFMGVDYLLIRDQLVTMGLRK